MITKNDQEYFESLLGKKEKNKLVKALRAGKTVIISGRPGATGKTTLMRYLQARGYNAEEAYNVHEVRLDEHLPKLVPNYLKEVL